MGETKSLVLRMGPEGGQAPSFCSAALGLALGSQSDWAADI